MNNLFFEFDVTDALLDLSETRNKVSQNVFFPVVSRMPSDVMKHSMTGIEYSFGLLDGFSQSKIAGLELWN